MEKDGAKKVRIAYYCVNDPLDKRSWSGITYYLGQSLQRNIGEVDFIGPVKFPRWLEKVLRGMAKFTRVFFKKEYYTKYSFLLNWYSTRYLKRRMRGKEYDFICGPASCPALAGLKTDLPVIHVHDATFKLLSNYYKEFEKASRISKMGGRRWSGRRLGKVHLSYIPPTGRPIQRCGIIRSRLTGYLLRRWAPIWILILAGGSFSKRKRMGC